MRIELLLLLVAGCGVFERPGAEQLAPASAPAAIRADCELAARRCSACHTLDRVLSAPAEPAITVRRMRLMPGSGILLAEEPAIVDCLLYAEAGP
jgi:hypothetical protein